MLLRDAVKCSDFAAGVMRTMPPGKQIDRSAEGLSLNKSLLTLIDRLFQEADLGPYFCCEFPTWKSRNDCGLCSLHSSIVILQTLDEIL